MNLLDTIVSWVQRELGSLLYVSFLTMALFLDCRLSGKLTYASRFTQFINLTSGSDLATSGSLESCTKDVQFGKPFDLDGRRVVLIDTPGFDDTKLSEVDVLNMIAAFLKNL